MSFEVKLSGEYPLDASSTIKALIRQQEAWLLSYSVDTTTINQINYMRGMFDGLKHAEQELIALAARYRTLNGDDLDDDALFKGLDEFE
jgi:hypothetical protein